MNFPSFKLTRVYLDPLSMSNAADFSWSWIPKDFYTSSKRWREIRRSMSTSSFKRQIRRFHVVVTCSGRQRNVLKSVMHVQSCFFFIIKPIVFFLSRRCGRSRGCLSFLIIAGDNSRHFMTPPLVSPRNDVWETTAEIPWYWWRVTTKIWFVLLVEENFSPDTTNQKRYPDLGSDTSSVWNLCGRCLGKWSFRGETSRGVTKCRLFSKGL